MYNPVMLMRYEMIHIGEKLYSCTFCSKKFRLKEEMKKHERVFTNAKPYPCKYCNKKFSMLEYVIDMQACQHVQCTYQWRRNFEKSCELVHKGNKLYKCDICGKQFQFIYSMKHYAESIH